MDILRIGDTKMKDTMYILKEEKAGADAQHWRDMQARKVERAILN